MAEQTQASYTFKTAETLHADALIQRAAQKITQDNVASQETTNACITLIRQKLTEYKKTKSGYFSTSHLRKVAAKRRLLAQQNNVGVA
jgi:hypothetical protein